MIYYALEEIFQIHYKMTLANAIKVLDDKIKANQAEYNLDREEVKFLHCHLANRKNMNI